MMGFGFIWMILFWGALIVLAVWLIGLLFPAAKKQNNANDIPLTPLEILKTRYAQGELTTETYHNMVKTIQNSNIQGDKS